MGDLFQSARAEMAYLFGNMDTAIQTSKQTIETAQRLGAILSTGIAYRVWGQALYQLDRHCFEDVVQKFTQSVRILESGHNQMEAARTHFAWGQLYYDQGNADAARVHLTQASNMFSEGNANMDLENVAKLLARL